MSLMKMSDAVRRRFVRVALITVLAATYGSLAGCTHKTYIEEGRGHPYHEHGYDRR